MKIRGVNLGNWLVLEKWMHPELFAGVKAEDETDLSERLPRPELKERLKAHRDAYITQNDFYRIAAMGLNVVRLPVPHFVFDDCAPYVGCIGYVDRAFEYAEKAGIQILIDLHTAPDSQNGFDNGGICGVCKWHTKPENIERTLDVLERLAVRYKDRSALFGIQLLNEPASEEVFKISMERYQPSDPERAKGSSFIPTETLKDFYLKGYDLLRRHLDEDKAIVFHDGFRLKEWDGFMQGAQYRNILFDTHIYLGMGMEGEPDSLSKIAEQLEDYGRQLKQMRRNFPIVIGEWSLMNAIPGIMQLPPAQKKLVYRTIADLQQFTWESAADGWIFWSWKLLADVPGWSLCDCVLHDWFPNHVG